MPRRKLTDELTERLVGLVHGRPFIYDPSDDSHMDAQKASNFWQSVDGTLQVEGMNGE